MERTEYRVIVKDSSYDLIVDVNYFLKDGWVCLGGVSLSHDSYGRLVYAQAIIKNYEK